MDVQGRLLNAGQSLSAILTLAFSSVSPTTEEIAAARKLANFLPGQEIPGAVALEDRSLCATIVAVRVKKKNDEEDADGACGAVGGGGDIDELRFLIKRKTLRHNSVSVCCHALIDSTDSLVLVSCSCSLRFHLGWRSNKCTSAVWAVGQGSVWPWSKTPCFGESWL